MPYKKDYCGIYKIVNTETGCCYVGQSQEVKKRLQSHFSLLRNNRHTNKHLQNAFNKYGEDCFYGALEIECGDLDEMDALEEAFLNGDVWFEEKKLYNIAKFAKAPMRGKKHSKQTINKIKLGRRAATFDYRNPEYRAKISARRTARLHSDPKFIAKLKYIIDNEDKSYAEIGRLFNCDPSAVRKLAIKYRHKKGEF